MLLKSVYSFALEHSKDLKKTDDNKQTIITAAVLTSIILIVIVVFIIVCLWKRHMRTLNLMERNMEFPLRSANT